MAEIHTVDFSALNLDVDEADISEDSLQKLSAQLMNAFSTIGFVYLRNTGVSQKLIDYFFSTSREFFQLPLEVKEKCKVKSVEDFCMYTGLGQEAADPNKPGDLKEAFDIRMEHLLEKSQHIWPAETFVLREAFKDFFKVCSRLTSRILMALAVGLQLEERNFFDKTHSFEGKAVENELTILRSLYYPPVGDDVNEDQQRLGQHTDYGTITLLFQENVGGLLVRKTNSEWIEAKPIPGTVLVNIADLLQMWTSDRLVSTPHRVELPPRFSPQRSSLRQSVAFFVHPDSDVMVKCLDGNEKYPPVNSWQYLEQKIKNSYTF